MTQTKIDTLYYTLTRGDSPLVAAAIHNGHEVRHDLKDLFYLTPDERLRQENPYTGRWANLTDNQIIAYYSRFELDLNRPPEKAVYRKPEDAWGLQVWKEELPEEMVEESVGRYERFYKDVKQMLTKLVKDHGCLIVYDLHTYNHKPEGPEGKAADPDENPEVNIGTSNMNREKWAPVVEALTHSLSSYNYRGRHLDVRENVKFKGGHFVHWIHDLFGDDVCAMSISFKKFFMDEWTGEPDEIQVHEIKAALEQTTKPVLKALTEVCQV
ncbi:N-formylglutamate amidohydrolase [Pontibacter ummariensis]|uniref:N-formylglutamate amidohydrolase n=1 Tax=Pontibacter ummariensis TaxID=1610492 RepID=A0A239CGL0_9BACT|nr:N-formylglutamate amidohydrolase [Pontibacter ummariensis]PRY15022.1 N-formylglutamate amidohydrolase [Pontibacter ummariensis]SNS19345.1 N-formylglutamate amidohydrolase [Pontibacter ummariensis]